MVTRPSYDGSGFQASCARVGTTPAAAISSRSPTRRHGYLTSIVNPLTGGWHLSGKGASHLVIGPPPLSSRGFQASPRPL